MRIAHAAPVARVAPLQLVAAVVRKPVTPIDVPDIRADAIISLIAQSEEQNGFFARAGRWIRGLFKHVDPFEALHENIETAISNVATAELVAKKYTKDGSFDSDALRVDLEAIAKGHPEFIDEMIRYTSLIARNRIAIDRAGAPRPLRTEAIPYPQIDVVVKGMRLRAIDIAPTAPYKGTILFNTGHGGCLEEFTPMLIEPLRAAGYRVLAYDAPGTGYSDHPDVTYSLPFYEQTAVDFLDVMGVKTAIASGGSLGGDLSLRLGDHYPDRFPKVACWSAMGTWEKPHGFLSWGAKMMAKSRALFDFVTNIQSRFWTPKSNPNHEWLRDEAFRFRHDIDDAMFMRMTGQIASNQLANRTGRPKQPTLLVGGALDAGLNLIECERAYAKVMQESGAPFQLVELADTGHSIHAERPEELARLIVAFLSQPSA